MNKVELEALVAERTNINRHHATDAVKAVFDLISEALARGETVRITGFGTFSTKDRPARTGRNPRTGEAINVPASRRVSYRPGKTLKEEINEADQG